MSVGAAEAKMNLLRAQKEVLQVKADLHAANEHIAELDAALEQQHFKVKKVKKANLDLRWKEQYRNEELEALRKELTAMKEGQHVLVGFGSVGEGRGGMEEGMEGGMEGGMDGWREEGIESGMEGGRGRGRRRMHLTHAAR